MDKMARSNAHHHGAAYVRRFSILLDHAQTVGVPFRLEISIMRFVLVEIEAIDDNNVVVGDRDGVVTGT